MILLVHMVFGAAVGYKIYFLTGNAWLASILALLSHYFLDFFPHVEYLKSVENLLNKTKTGRLKSRFAEFCMVFLDFLIGILLVFFLAKNQTVYLFAFLGALPDVITAINSFFDIKILKIHQKFHGDIVQYLTKYKKFPLFWRILTQATAFLLSVFILIS